MQGQRPPAVEVRPWPAMDAHRRKCTGLQHLPWLWVLHPGGCCISPQDPPNSTPDETLLVFKVRCTRIPMLGYLCTTGMAQNSLGSSEVRVGKCLPR